MTGPGHPKLLPRDAAVAVVYAESPECMLALAAMYLRMPASSVHRSLGRLQAAGLMQPQRRIVVTTRLEEFLIYGMRYAFPPVIGRLADGVPTSLRSPMLARAQLPTDEYVWPVEGESGRGESLRPLYRTAPALARQRGNRRLYETLAVIDAIRVHGHHRVPQAIGFLRARLSPSEFGSGARP
jgi:hypothetical protein